MRVTDSIMARDLMARIQDVRSRLQRNHEKLATGKRLTRPADDPAGAARLLRIREELGRIGQYQRNLTQAEVRLAVTSDVINRVTNLVGRIQVVAGSAVTGTAAGNGRGVVADELDELVESLVDLASTTLDGKHIFSGSEVKTEPLAESGGSYSYQGDAREILIRIEEDRELRVNATADEIFTDPAADLLSSVGALATALRNDDIATARAELDTISAAAEKINSVGIRISQGIAEVERARPALDQRGLALTRQLSRIEDADMAEAISRLALDETALQATLAAGARVQQQMSLFDILA